MNTVYPIFFDSWTSGNFLAKFINLHFNINNSKITTVKQLMDAVEVPELYHSSHIFDSYALKKSRMPSMTDEKLKDILSDKHRIDFENEVVKYEKYAAPYLFHEPQFFTKELMNNKFSNIKPILVYWEPDDKFMIHRQVVGHNMSMDSYARHMNLSAQIEIKDKFEDQGVFCFRLQKLLDEDETYYKLLCNYIKADARDDWKDLIKAYKNTVDFNYYNQAMFKKWDFLLYPSGHCGNYLRANILYFITKELSDIKLLQKGDDSINEYTGLANGKKLPAFSLNATHETYPDIYNSCFSYIKRAILIYRRDRSYLKNGRNLDSIKKYLNGDDEYLHTVGNLIANDKQVEELKNIYDEISNKFKAQGTLVHEIEWKNLFVNPTPEEYKKLCDFLEKDFSFDGYNHLVDYVNKNIKLLEKYNVSIP